ncbi:MAG: CRISPR-associated protein Cas4 [Candidatus Odinarchaeum yellowstonii]|uniref:CRISPR-associated exonuclease Cas4 n=1 Tax=Odinarchaeota yellowstonii (strain LCB_4) TaxID=1841599 RepID=A0AAF0D277_ODILC|nr:MAG: CRISPR-associated protein Cas4 [Candidatus Odinarchaeum yellowstonii]
MSEDELNYIPAKWIEIYHYCPRIIYFIGVLKVTESEKEYMKEGKQEEEHEAEKEKRRKTLLAKRKEKILEKWINLKLSSPKLELIGIIDLAVNTNEGLKIIDIKNTDQEKLQPGYLYQTAAYALLAEEYFKKPVKNIIIYHTKNDKIFEIKLTDQIKQHVKWTITRIKQIIEKEKIPKTKFKKQCQGCGYYPQCKAL